MKHKTLSSLFLIITLNSLLVSDYIDAQFQFSDVAHHHWAYESIQQSVEDGVLDGFPDGTFKPEGNVTEEAFVKIALLTLSTTKEIPETKSYWSNPHYIIMKNLGISLDGEHEIRYRQQVLTRGEVAVILAELITRETVNEKEAIQYLFDEGFTNGVQPNGTYEERFEADQSLKRAEAVTFLQRVKTQIGESELIPSTLSDLIYQAIIDIQPDVDTSLFTTNSDTVFSAIIEIVDNHPELFYLDYDTIRYWSNGLLEFEYKYSTDEVEQMLQNYQSTNLYDYMFRAILDLEDEINVGYYSTDSYVVFQTLEKIYEEHPEIFYFDYYYDSKNTFWSNGKLQLSYEFPNEQIEEMQADIEEKTEIILSELIKPKMNDFDKVQAIHEYIVKSVVYDESAVKAIENGQRFNEMNQTIYGALIEGKAVCGGYAQSMQYLLEKEGIETLFVVGEVDGIGHTWNKVKLNNKWYNLDATWNDPVPDIAGRVNYNYFLVPDEVLDESHQWIKENYPEAISTDYRSYYRKDS